MESCALLEAFNLEREDEEKDGWRCLGAWTRDDPFCELKIFEGIGPTIANAEN